MPEIYDLSEATRLVNDVCALLAETESGDADPERDDRLGREEAEALLEDERLRHVIDRKETFYREVAALWGTMKIAFDRRDMALVRGAHAGLRSLALRELEGGVAD